MPLYRMFCKKCNEAVARLCTPTKYKEGLHCKTCNELLERVVNPPSTLVTETLDNGIMARRVVRPANAEELFKDRATADTIRKKGGDPRPL